MPLWGVWAIIGAICLCSEALHPGLFIFLPFSVAAYVTAIIALYWTYVWLHVTVFVCCVSTAFFIFHRWSLRGKAQETTNVYALVGSTGYVVTPITEYQKGYIYINGQYWLADAEIALSERTPVRIIGIRGCHLIVTPIDRRYV